MQTDTAAFDGLNLQGTRRVQTQYNNLGEVAQKSEPYVVGASSVYWTQYSYDQLGRVYYVSLPDGGLRIHVYDGLKQTDALPPVTGPFAPLPADIITPVNPQRPGPSDETFVTLLDGLGQTASTTDPLGNVTTYSYFPFGSLASVTDQAGNTVSYSYDPLGRRTGITDPDAGARSFGYYSTGELRWSNAPASSGTGLVTANFVYDQLGRPTSRTEPDLTSSWSYDQAGALGLPATASTGLSDAAGYPGG